MMVGFLGISVAKPDLVLFYPGRGVTGADKSRCAFSTATHGAQCLEGVYTKVVIAPREFYSISPDQIPFEGMNIFGNAVVKAHPTLTDEFLAFGALASSSQVPKGIASFMPIIP